MRLNCQFAGRTLSRLDKGGRRIRFKVKLTLIGPVRSSSGRQTGRGPEQAFRFEPLHVEHQRVVSTLWQGVIFFGRPPFGGILASELWRSSVRICQSLVDDPQSL